MILHKMAFLAAILFFFVSSSIHVHSRETFACDTKDAATATLRFCQQSVPIPERVKDLIGRLTLAEKVSLLGNTAAAIPRLGIKGYEWWSEALHGVSNVGPGTKFAGPFPAATSFPQVITTAASFNASLWESIGRGGDLIKWVKARIWLYVVIDIAEGSIEDCRTRYNGDADQHQVVRSSAFLPFIMWGLF